MPIKGDAADATIGSAVPARHRARPEHSGKEAARTGSLRKGTAPAVRSSPIPARPRPSISRLDADHRWVLPGAADAPRDADVSIWSARRLAGSRRSRAAAPAATNGAEARHHGALSTTVAFDGTWRCAYAGVPHGQLMRCVGCSCPWAAGRLGLSGHDAPWAR